MDESVYRRLCMTSVCGAILIPVTMALVSGHGTQARTDPAFTAATVASTTAIEVRDDATRPSPSDRTTP